jgi:hypothetical protein
MGAFLPDLRWISRSCASDGKFLPNREIEPGDRIGEDRLEWKVSVIYPPVRKPFSQFTVEGLIASLP